MLHVGHGTLAHFSQPFVSFAKSSIVHNVLLSSRRQYASYCERAQAGPYLPFSGSYGTMALVSQASTTLVSESQHVLMRSQCKAGEDGGDGGVGGESGTGGGGGEYGGGAGGW